MLKKVNPNFYDVDYFLSNNTGFEEFKAGLQQAKVNYKFCDVLQCCSFSPEKRILDIGCGRGELVYYAAKFGCKEAVGIDYSPAAIQLANMFKTELEKDVQARMTFMNIDALDLPEVEKFDYIFMIEVWEHMYDDQIRPLIDKIRLILKDDGILIITTPNRFYEKYLYPAKRILNIPGNLFKFPMRILRGKWKPASFKDLLRHIFKIQPFPDAFMEATHVNVCAPPKIRRILKAAGFKAEIRCRDASRDPLTLLFAHYAGREMLVIARIAKGACGWK